MLIRSERVPGDERLLWTFSLVHSPRTNFATTGRKNRERGAADPRSKRQETKPYKASHVKLNAENLKWLEFRKPGAFKGLCKCEFNQRPFNALKGPSAVLILGKALGLPGLPGRR
jgi:hypothetical protein